MKSSEADTVELRNSRFLITQSQLRYFGGSEVTTLELAQYLNANAKSVSVFTYQFDEPIKTVFESVGIDVIVGLDADVHLADYDYVWVHHQVLPLQMVLELAENPTSKPKFIFMHMSAMKTNSFERPYIFQLEQKLSGRTLYNSLETKSSIEADYFQTISPPSSIYPNPAPVEFAELEPIRTETRRIIALISNHPPVEVLEALTLLEHAGWHALRVGMYQGAQVDRVTPGLLAQCDVVISIGKTVQYCLVGGIPIYVYDHFGGPGYLNDGNFKLAEELNFSGRGFRKKSAKDIFEEIVSGLSSSREWQQEHQVELNVKFRLDKVLARVLNRVDESNHGNFDPDYVSYLIAAQRIAADQIRGTLERDDLQRALAETREESQKELHSLHARLAKSEQLTESRENEINEIHGSATWRIGRAMLSPLRLLRKSAA